MSIQINKLEQELQAQASRIDVIFSAVGIECHKTITLYPKILKLLI